MPVGFDQSPFLREFPQIRRRYLLGFAHVHLDVIVDGQSDFRILPELFWPAVFQPEDTSGCVGGIMLGIFMVEGNALVLHDLYRLVRITLRAMEKAFGNGRVSVELAFL